MSAHGGTSDSSNGPLGAKMPAVVPLASVEHGHPSTRTSTNNFNPSRAPSSNATPLHTPTLRSKRDSPAGSPSHRSRSNNASAFFSPSTKGELLESGISTSTKRTGGLGEGGGQAIPAAPAAPAASAEDSTNAGPKGTGAAAPAPEVAWERKGRRASRQGNANWFEGGKTNRPVDTELNQNVATVNDGVADQELARREQAERAQRQQEQLARHISDPPTGFQATLPRLSELDVTNSWDKLLRMMRNEYDMSCLTNCLARELDEDVAWNPDMLLVQLTSDMMDAAELQKDNEVYVPVDASDIGQMTGGEVVRKRGEKAAVLAQGDTGAVPQASAAAAANGDTQRAAAGAGGAASPKTTASVVGPDPAAKSSPTKRKSSASSRAAPGAAASSPRKEGKPMSAKKGGTKSFIKK
jgi:hypothetical protein